MILKLAVFLPTPARSGLLLILIQELVSIRYLVYGLITDSQTHSTMTGTAIGMTVILIILVPIFFQVIMLGIKQEKRHREIMEELSELKDRTR